MTVIYQAYVRSFADSDGDGVGDLPGLRSRLDHLQWLGVNVLWLSPTFPTPNVDWGYDVSHYHAVNPEYGELADLDGVIADARERGIDVWLDLVPNHTSDKHDWFTDRPEYYVWSPEIPNDWESVFTEGPAWHFDSRRGAYYMHQFAPQQPDLDWWNPDVRHEFERILRFWFDRGVAGLRIDVAHALVKDRELRDGVEHMRERPEVHDVYARWQEIAKEYEPKRMMMGETVVALEKLFAYWQHLDLPQNHEICKSNFELDELRPIVEEVERRVPDKTPVWFGSNHDHSRLATRWAQGDERKARAALFMLLTLRGYVILYQGDEIALTDGDVPEDCVLDIATPGRDPSRTPLPWTAAGEEWVDPWLPLTDTARNVEEQRADPESTLHYVRDLIARRKAFVNEPYRTLPSATGVWAYARGATTCVLNMTGVVVDHEGHTLQPWQGLIL
ncbi:MAG: alpha-amylase [Actinobacteria bacterium]|nr:alpha-amylase [Actinomycetota bacterium]